MSIIGVMVVHLCGLVNFYIPHSIAVASDFYTTLVFDAIMHIGVLDSQFLTKNTDICSSTTQIAEIQHMQVVRKEERYGRIRPLRVMKPTSRE